MDLLGRDVARVGRHHRQQDGDRDVGKRLGLDIERFRAELIDGAYTARVERDAEGARAAGIARTPTFIVNGVQHTESFDAGSLVEALTA
jgi:predicted DsbA family dithiol-disulfide isomerase